MRRATPTDATRELLDVEGWVAIPGIVAPDEAAAVAEQCAAGLAGLDGDLRVGDKAASGTRRLVELRDRFPQVAIVATDPRVTAAVQSVLGDDAQLGGVTYRSPEPGFGEQRFHADAIALDKHAIAARRWGVCTMVMALCEFTETNGATSVIPGSHLRADQQRLSGNLERHDSAIVLTGDAGTAFVFNGHLLHRGSMNRSAAPRPALQVTWFLPG